MDNKAYCYFVFLYLSSTFDTLNNLIFLPGFDIEIIQLLIDNCINDLIFYFSCNSLLLNITKTYRITFSIHLSSITLTYTFLIPHSYIKHHHYSRFYY